MNARIRATLIQAVAIPLIAIVAGLLVASIFILMAHADPLAAYLALFQSGFGCGSLTRCNLFTTLQLATPLIFTSLSAVLAFRSGMFSLGQEGQLILGGLAAAWLGYAIHLPPLLHPLVALAGAALVGGAYAWLPGMLKVRLSVNEIISTIVLNSIAELFVRYLINFPLRANASTNAASPMIDTAARLPNFVTGSKFGVGFLLAIGATILATIYLWRTAPGYEQRMAGQAPWFARYAGIPVERAATRGMFLSGALAGLAGGVQALGVHYRMLEGFSSGLGSDGLTAAVLGQVHPLGAFVAAIFFAGLRQGAQVGLQFAVHIPRELGGGIIALIILFVAADKPLRRLFARRRPAEASARSLASS